MADTNTEVPEDDSTSIRKASLLWPALATILAFPVIVAVVSLLLLWLVHSWNAPPWALLLFAIPLITIGSYALWYWMRSWAERRFRFSLKGMLLGMTLVAVVLGTAGRSLLQLFRQEQAVWNIAASGGSFDSWNIEKDNWLKARIGYDPLGGVEAIDVRTAQVIPALLQNPDPFTELRHLCFGRRATDAFLKYAAELNQFPKLDSAQFIGAPLTDNGMRHLKQWTRLKNLFFNGGAFTDKGLAHLTSLPNLEILGILGDEIGALPITDKGLEHIGKMPHLKILNLTGIPITDAGLASLQSLPNLERLAFRRTNITEEGFRNFCEAQPNCWTLGEYAFFPIATQIRQISVWNDLPKEKLVATISDPIQIVAIRNFLQRHVDSNTHERDNNLKAHFSIKIEGPDRCLCQIHLKDECFFTVYGSYYRMTNSEADELRRLLDILSEE